MWTQVTHGQLVDEIMIKIGSELNIEFQQPSVAMFPHYRDGEWLYDEDGQRLDTKISRLGHGRGADCQRSILAQREGQHVS